MKPLRRNPHIYEINLILWLSQLSRSERKHITLANVPQREWRKLRRLGIDLVWLMGVWRRSPHSKRTARQEPALLEQCRQMLEDFELDDIAGSPYAVYAYQPEPAFGSREDIVHLKKVLEQEGLRLILDFVPNHTACDHAWINDHPEYYVSKEKISESCPEGFFSPDTDAHRFCFAHGRDPFFPPWTDTAQINYRCPDAVEAVLNTVSQISSLCHGLRCDMAMLALNEVFEETWRGYLKEKLPEEEFWARATRRLDLHDAHFLWLAEAYWGLEERLASLGFDYAYDKTFYELLVQENIGGLRSHLSRPMSFQEKAIRFLENHDEPRAADRFKRQSVRCAMVIHATVPGMRFWQHGQMQGNRYRVPVQLRRQPDETKDIQLELFCRELMREVDHPVFHSGDWQVCETTGWSDNQSHKSFLAWCWRQGEDRRLVVANFSSAPAHGHVHLPKGWLPGGTSFICRDPLNEDRFQRSTSEVESDGLYVGLDQKDFHFFRIEKE